MKKFTKILFILFIMLLILGLATYIDYFIVKTKNTIPKIAIKEEINENLVVYNAFMYRLWYCKSNNKYTLGDYGDKDAVCISKERYDKNGNYINDINVLISPEELNILEKYFNLEEINVMSQQSIKDYVFFIKEYSKTQYKVLDAEESNKIKDEIEYDIVTFPSYELIDEKYELTYDDTLFYCKDKNEFSLYENEKCNKFSKLSLSDEACSIYEDETLKSKIDIGDLCEE